MRRILAVPVLACLASVSVLALQGQAPPTTARTFVKGDVLTVGAGVVIPPASCAGPSA